MKRRLRWAVVAFAALLVPAIAIADDEVPAPKEDEPAGGAVAEQAGPPAKKPAAAPKPPEKEKAKDDTVVKDKEKEKPKDDAAAKKQASPEDKALRGVVSIERAGQTLSLGGVLGGDGRILTALSPLGSGNDLEARFHDGSTVRVKLGHHDRMWDLALLVPQAGRWHDGLVASSREPVRQDATIHAFSLANKKIAATSMVLRSHRTLLGGDDKKLENAIEIGSRVSPLDLGSPVIDEDGRVVAVLGRGCAPNEGKPCTPVAFGAPVTAIRNFLRTVPPTAISPSAWLGIQGVAESGGVAKGVRVLVVHPESPADEAHLKGGDKDASDVILAVAGTPVTTPDALADAIRAHGVGEKVALTLFSQGKYREVHVLLRAAPEARPAPPPPANPAELPPLNDQSPAPPQAPAKKPAAPRAPAPRK